MNVKENLSPRQKICILGSTGSIGTSTLDVVSRHPERYKIFALTAHSQMQKLCAQCVLFLPQVVVVGSHSAANELSQLFIEKKLDIEILVGEKALCQVASSPECDIVMAAIVGAAGLPASLAAAQAGKKILLANKEALVMSGQLFIDAVKRNNATLLPIDSEHNAIFQCLPSNYDRNLANNGIHKILLTASGGPFLNRDINTLNAVTPEEAIVHPNWAMGKKISVDSATMMNKGLEVIEAHWLFNAPAEKIDVLIHPQSVVHSMVSYIDGSVLAQLGNPDMRTPIAYGLAYPERIDSGVNVLDLTQLLQLNFHQPDLQRFPCLGLAYAALKHGGTAPTILNAANEIAVEAFLNRRISFRAIDQLITRVMNAVSIVNADEIEAVLAIDRETRHLTSSLIAKMEME